MLSPLIQGGSEREQQAASFRDAEFALRPLLHPIDRCRDLGVCGAFAEVCFDLHPADAAFGVEDEDGGVWDAVFFFAGVGFVAEVVAVDDSRERVGKERERQSSAVIGGDEGGEFTALFRRVGADGVELHVGVGAGEVTKSDDLPDAIRSPVAAVEDEDDFRPGGIREADAFAVLIAEREGGRLLSDFWRGCL